MVSNFKLMLSKYIYKLGERFRNPSLKQNFHFLKSSEKWSLEELENYQLEQLKQLLKAAFNHSKYYNNKFRAYKIDVSNFSSLEDLTKIPILEKDEIIKYAKNIHTNIKFDKTFVAVTSGTSGKSLKFKRNENADSFNRASSLRGYSWYNVKPWELNGYFWGFNFGQKERLKSKILDALQNRFRVFSYQNKDIKQFAKKSLKAKYIHGYSSMIYQTAVIINKLNLPKPKNIKLVKGTSEKILPSYQSQIKEAFGVHMVSEYGATETGIIAFECKFGAMHINMEGVLVEEINNEIVVTNLQMNSFPIIRYKLGDYIKLATKEQKCSCGLNHRILEEVTGRVGNNIYGIQEIYPSLYIYYIFKNILKKHKVELNYQVIQHKKGELNFSIEQEISKHLENILHLEIESYFKNDMNYTVSCKKEFIQSKTGKLKNFISNI